MNTNAQTAVRSLTAFALLLLVFGGASSAPALENPTECLACHGDTVDADAYGRSAHKDLACTVCHLVDRDTPAPAKDGETCVASFTRTDCAVCHAKETGEYLDSAHNSQRLPVPCAKCHAGIHAIEPHKEDKVRGAEICVSCHSRQQPYFDSVHYAGVVKGNADSPACTDCHGTHTISTMDYDAEGRQFHTRACLTCHDDPEMMERNDVTPIAAATFFHSFHGKNVRLGYPERVAGCADCHDAHPVLPADNPASSVNSANLLETCGKCHPGASANFVQFQPHGCHCNPDKYPALYWTFVFMSSLLVGTFVFFWAHTILWWRKTFWEKRNLCTEGEVIDPRLGDIPAPAQCYWRFTPLARVMHLILLTSFFALVLTGMPLRFSEAGWASTLMDILGGTHVAGIIHRIAAAVLVTLFTGTLVMSIRFLLDKKNGATFKERLFSPDSLFPRMKDWEDFKGMVLWFFDRGPEPEFDRWTYWEKFDFLAVFWGMTAIGLSGLLLWLPEATARILPGWLFNVALIVHSDEALLATGFIFTVHFFNTHLIPTKFPMDSVIFTGRIRKWQFIREKPLYWKRLEESGQLESKRATQPPVFVMLASAVIGYTAVAVGLGIMVLGFVHLIF